MIEITNLRKSFRVFRSRRTRLKTAFGFGAEGRDYDIVEALKGVNLTVPGGSVHGIIGMNGAGKSTLLKILTGVIDPTDGSVSLSGRVSALLELGTGFHGELTGRENILMNGSIMGFSKEELSKKIAEIRDFSELGEFFDRPVRIYSSGMYVRLAFAFAIAIDPEVLIIDEALSVGDAYFQQKCLARIRDFRDSGVTILFVSHDLSAIKMLCDSVSLMANGEILKSGQPAEVLELYNALLSRHLDVNRETVAALEARAPGKGVSSGTMEVIASKVRLLDENEREAEVFVSGSMMTVEITAQCQAEEISELTCGFMMKDRLGYDIFGTNSWHLAKNPDVLRKGDTVRFIYRFRLDLGKGTYTVSVSLHTSRTHLEKNYHWLDRAALFEVVPNSEFEFVGVVRLLPSLTLEHSRVGNPQQ